MKPSLPWLRTSLALALLAWGTCQAQILIGQTVGVTGSAAATVQEASQGASLYLDHVNAKGGVGGQKIELLTLDDKFDTKLTLDNARVLIEQKGVLGLFMTRGTPSRRASCRCWSSMACPWWAHQPGPLHCTSLCTSTCSTCARPTSTRWKRRYPT